MKILKIFGVVVGIHVAALILIFANPGCSTSTRPAPSPADTVVQADAPAISVPSMVVPESIDTGAPAAAPTLTGFDPDAPATASSYSSVGVRFNPTRPNTPAATAVVAAPVEDVTPVVTYTVKPGDSLWNLQKKFHVDYRTIAAANNMKTGEPLRPGKKLIIPKKTPSKAAASAAASQAAAEAPVVASAPASATKSSGDEVTHVVKPGETIEGIARRYDISAKELALHNNVTNPLKLRAGTVLNIPGGWRSVSSSQARSGSSTSAAAAPVAAPEPMAVPNILEQEVNQQPAASSIPVIRIDEEAPIIAVPNS